MLILWSLLVYYWSLEVLFLSLYKFNNFVLLVHAFINLRTFVFASKCFICLLICSLYEVLSILWIHSLKIHVKFGFLWGTKQAYVIVILDWITNWIQSSSFIHNKPLSLLFPCVSCFWDVYQSRNNGIIEIVLQSFEYIANSSNNFIILNNTPFIFNTILHFLFFIRCFSLFHIIWFFWQKLHLFNIL